jgi:hypothetical protein
LTLVVTNKVDPDVEALDATPSISATNILLHQCLQWTLETSVERRKCSEMVVVVKSLMDQLMKPS